MIVGSAVFILFSLFMAAYAALEVHNAGADAPSVIGVVVGSVIGSIVLVVNIRGAAAAMKSTSGTALSTYLFGSMTLQVVGAVLIFVVPIFMLDAEGNAILNYRPALMAYGAAVFLGFAYLPKLVQGPGTDDTANPPEEDKA